MTVGRVVDYDPSNRTYLLPPEHAALLTRAAGPDNFASMAQFTSLMGGVEDDIVACFRDGGGVPYAKFPQFQAAHGRGERPDPRRSLIDGSLPSSTAWSTGCGRASTSATSDAGRAMPSTSWPGRSRTAGSPAGTSRARASPLRSAEAEQFGLTNATFEVKDAATIDGSQQFDLITVFDAIHDQAEPDAVLHGIADSLKPDGVFLCVDIAGSSNVEDNMSTRWRRCSTPCRPSTA